MQFQHKNVALVLQRSDIMEEWDVHLMEAAFSHVFVATAMPKSSETKVHCWLKTANKSAGILVGTFSTSTSDTLRLLHHILSSAADRLPHCSSAPQKQNVKVFLHFFRKENNHTKLGAILGHRNCSFSWTPAAPAHFCLVWLTGCWLWLDFKLQK